MGSTPLRILGPLELDEAGSLGGPKQRALLALFLLSPNETLSRDRLVDRLWPQDPPPTAAHAVQVYISQVRKALPAAAAIVATGSGYRLDVDDSAVDAKQFERLVEEGRASLADGAAEEASRTLTEALSLWRGAIEDAPLDDPNVTRLDELRVAALEDRFEAELDLAHHEALVPELEAAVADHPLRERLRGQLMLALYRSGRQADALAAYHESRRAFRDELGLDPTPELRDLEGAILRQEPTLLVESAEVRARRRLPAPVTPLVGRRREVEEVAGMLRGDARLVTLVGPGGIGKTRVGLQTAHELADRFRDGVVFVGLAPLRDPALVLAEIANAVDVESTEALAEKIRDRQLLLLVDNFEQVDDAAPDLGALLSEAAGLRLLVTSRHPLRLYGEVEYVLPPLSEEEAVALFVARARSVRLGFAAADGLAEVCERLDRLPLAIELVAAHARELSIAQMLDTLPALELAGDGPRDVPARHQSLRSAIAWSHDLLSEEERLSVARLGVFAGGFTRETAADVCDVNPEILTSLVERSLLLNGDGRLTMLETIREFALEQLDASSGDGDIRGRHAKHFLELARSSETVRRTERELEWMDAMERERDNVRAALAWWAEHDGAQALALADGAYRFWYIRGYHAEGRRAFEQALAAAGGVDAHGRAPALMYTAAFAFALGDLESALRLAQESLAVWRETEDPAMTARALVLLGTILGEQGKAHEALPLLEESVELAGVTKEAHLLAFTTSHLAAATLNVGRFQHAFEIADAAAALMRSAGDVDGERGAYDTLGAAAWYLNDNAGAYESFITALKLSIEAGNPTGIVGALNGIAAVAGRSGQAEIAARLLGASSALTSEREVTLEESPRRILDDAIAATRAALGEERFTGAFAAGQELSVEEALAEAEAIGA